MEHVMHVVEAVLAIFASLKFCHEVFEVAVHVVKLVRK
jgi:hypothetical protein